MAIGNGGTEDPPKEGEKQRNGRVLVYEMMEHENGSESSGRNTSGIEWPADETSLEQVGEGKEEEEEEEEKEEEKEEDGRFPSDCCW